MGAYPRQKILQVHPSLRCNLTCGHCYSESGPRVAAELDVGIAADAIRDARHLGYRVLAVSGGEPLLYPGLATLLDVARDSGMTTTMTTNGMLLRQARAQPILDRLDGLAISLDGPPDVHNRIRGHSGAFASIPLATQLLRDRQLRFGFISTLTQTNWHHLRWLTEFAVDQGADLLQIHPLEMVGRALEEMADDGPRQEALGQAFLLVTALRARYAGSLTIGFDVLLRDQILREPQLVYAGESQPLSKGISSAEMADGTQPQEGADLLGLLIIEADGAVVPISYGFSRDYAVGNISVRPLIESFGDWTRTGRLEFLALCRSVWDEIVDKPEEQVVNWHARVVERSRQVAVQ